MAQGDKPVVKVSMKPRDGGGGRISLCAAWRDEDSGRLRASFDRRVKAVKLMLDDGSVVTARRGDDGKWSHFVDIYEGDAPLTGAAASAARREPQRTSSGGYGPAGAGDGPDDFGGDDIPFAKRAL